MIFTIEYQEYSSQLPMKDYEVARSKADAYKQFMDKHNWTPYAAWVSAVTYQNGKYKIFNTFAGKPY